MANEAGSNGRVPELSNGQIVVAAGVGAGAVAAVLTALRGNDDEASTPAERLDVALDSTEAAAADLRAVAIGASADHASDLQAADETTGAAVVETGRRARKKARKLQEQARQTVDQVTERDASVDLVEQVSATQEAIVNEGRGARRAARKAAKAARRAAEPVQAAISQTTEEGTAMFGKASKAAQQTVDDATATAQQVGDEATSVAQRVSEQTIATAQSIAHQAASAAVAAAERAREAGTAVAGTAKERVPPLSHKVTEKISEDIAPSLRDVALQAASAALDLWHATRERATSVAETAQSELAPQAAHLVGAGSERAREAGTAVAGVASGVASEVGGRAKEASSAVAGAASEVGGRARMASRRAAEATVETSKDTGAMLFWAGVAAGLVFYALLDEQRREQLLRGAETVIGQVSELIKDFQGYDDEF